MARLDLLNDYYHDEEITYESYKDKGYVLLFITLNVTLKMYIYKIPIEEYLNLSIPKLRLHRPPFRIHENFLSATKNPITVEAFGFERKSPRSRKGFKRYELYDLAKEKDLEYIKEGLNYGSFK